MTIKPNGAGDTAPDFGASGWGVVLLGHGSQRGASRMECSCGWREETVPAWCRHCPSTPAGLEVAARQVQEELDIEDEQLVLSCLEFIKPHPDEAVRVLDQRGLRRVVVMPFLLGNGKHANEELNEILDEVRAGLPGVRLLLADGFGSDPGLADLIVERVRDIEGDAAYRPKDGVKGILVVKAGTKTQYDDCLWLEELGQMVEQRLGLDYAVDVAQSHYGDPTMDYAAARLVEGRGRRVHHVRALLVLSRDDLAPERLGRAGPDPREVSLGPGLGNPASGD